MTENDQNPDPICCAKKNQNLFLLLNYTDIAWDSCRTQIWARKCHQILSHLQTIFQSYLKVH